MLQCAGRPSGCGTGAAIAAAIARSYDARARAGECCSAMNAAARRPRRSRSARLPARRRIARVTAPSSSDVSARTTASSGISAKLSTSEITAGRPWASTRSSAADVSRAVG